MIFPTLWIGCQTPLGSDVHGQPLLGQLKRERVAPVKLIFDSAHTTVRTDSSGSHGHAYEVTANVVLLALPSSIIAIGDILTVLGNSVQVIERHPRYRVDGVLDHLRIGCTAWK